MALSIEFEELNSAGVEYCPHVAIRLDRRAIVRHHYDVASRHTLGEYLCAFFAELCITDLGDLIDQINVEVDGKAHSKGQLCAHPGRISHDRHVEVSAEF